ncbi:peptide ABC transporter substrate-binding protein [Candidatus Saccharibacteria bacterium]|nr:peptide ABC transporter substrate-binding protein [Candidatus Saccharibacteria bacterium]
MDDVKQTYRRFRMRARRKVRKQTRHVTDITLQADDSLDRHLFKRFGRLYGVRRFVAAWTLLVLFIGLAALWQVRGLNAFYLKSAPVPGGVYREGLIGHFTTANPIFAVGSADVSVARLVFSGLLKLAPGGELVPDLASGYSVDDTGLVYTMSLRRDVTWHDGEPFTAADVVFTYSAIKNPEVKSSLQSGWSNVTVKAVDDYTVTFTLPNALSAFEYSLTNGLLPEHILGAVAPADLRSSTFNSVDPVGTGPFTYKLVEVLGDGITDRHEKITLERNNNYYQKPANIEGVSIRTYRDEESMLEAFDEKEISAMVGLQTISDAELQDGTVQTFNSPLSSQVMIFLNNSSTGLDDAKVRRALLLGTDTKTLRQSIGYQLLESDSPFLRSHFTYDDKKVQATFDSNAANKLLDEAGWTRGPDGKRQKEGKELHLRLVSQSLTEYATIVQGLQDQWSKLGIGVDAILQPEEDVQSGAIANHSYDVFLYGIALGPDPDVFAYWHSTQADPRIKTRLNFSEYKNPKADTALEAGRTRRDEELRKIKYEPFLDTWLADTPAIALYQPRFLFVVRGTLEGYASGELNSPADRFYSITDWLIRRDRTIK